MSELTDLNATGNGLAAVSGGLQGLLEAYKMRMAQNVEQAKITQQGLDAGAQARAMAPYYATMGNAAGLNAAANVFDKTGQTITPPAVGSSPSAPPAVGGATSAAAPTSNPFMAQVQEVKAGRQPPTVLDMKKPATALAWQAASKPGEPSYDDLVAAQKQKDFQNSPATKNEQADARALIDNLTTMQAMAPDLGMPKNLPQGLMDSVTQAPTYANLKLQSMSPGSAIYNLINKTGPAAMAAGKNFTGRFTMAEVPTLDKPQTVMQPEPSFINGLQAYKDQLATKTNQPGYQGQILYNTVDRSQFPTMFSAPGAPPAPGATPAPAAPSGSLPQGAAPAAPAMHPVVAAALGAGGPPPPPGQVHVAHPDGTPGYIPQEQLQDAVSQGYTQIP